MKPPLTLFAVLLLLATTRGQEPAKRAPTIRSDATTMIVPAGSWPVRTLIDATAKFLQINILCNEAELLSVKPVQLQTSMTLERSAAEERLSQILFGQGLVLVPRANAMAEVLNQCGQRQKEIGDAAVLRSEAEILARREWYVPVKVTIRLQNANLAFVTNTLRPFFGVGGDRAMSLGTIGTDTLVLSGLQPDVAHAIELVYRADGRDPAAPLESAAGPPVPESLAALLARVAELERRLAELTRDKPASGK